MPIEREVVGGCVLRQILANTAHQGFKRGITHDLTGVERAIASYVAVLAAYVAAQGDFDDDVANHERTDAILGLEPLFSNSGMTHERAREGSRHRLSTPNSEICARRWRQIRPSSLLDRIRLLSDAELDLI